MRHFQSLTFNGRTAAMFTFAFIMGFGFVHPALAQSMTFGDVFCNLQFNMSFLPDLFGAIAYISGVLFFGQGLYGIVNHTHDPNSKPWHHAFLKIFGGAALLAAPEVAQVIVQTLFYTPSGGGINSCNVTVPRAGGTGLDVMMSNFVMNIKDPMTSALSALAIVMGVFMVVRGLMKASKHGMDPRTHSVAHILANLIIGAILLVVGQSLDMMMSTVFGGPGVTPSSVVGGWAFVQQLNAGQQFVDTIRYSLMFMQVVGFIAFIRGWLILKHHAEGSGQATMGQGLTHIVGGVMAVNIFNFLEVVDSSFGSGFL
jgi:hypothetical protein